MEPETEMRPEPEIPVSEASVTTCEAGLGATGPSATNITSLFASAIEPEVVTANTSKEVTTTSLFTAPSQTSTHNMVHFFH